MSTLECGNLDNQDSMIGLRIGAIFIILFGSSFGALFPVIANRTSWINVPKKVFEFAKFFGSGVIIATAFIHLLASGVQELGSPCLSPAWQIYPYAIAWCMFSVFAIFFIELLAFRWGTSKLKKLGISYNPHGHNVGSHAAHGPEGNPTASEVPNSSPPEKGAGSDVESVGESQKTLSFDDSAMTQVLGIAILEFGIILHSVLIGLTLAVDQEFKILFVVIIFHQTFEGLGVGSRLAFIRLPPKYNWVPIFGGVLYAICTPIGMIAGLGIRSTYNPGSTTASIVTGTMDSISAGILLYTGLVELLAHEFLFNKDMINSSNGKLSYALTCMCFGCGIMALLGKWA